MALLARGAEPVLIRRELPGDAMDVQARYLEAAINGIICTSIYFPNGNPWPGPKFNYKMAWMERFNAHAAELLATGQPVVLAGDYNVVPTDADIYNTRSWLKNALLQPEPRKAYADLLAQGWTDALHTKHSKVPVYTFWSVFRQSWGARRRHANRSHSPEQETAQAPEDCSLLPKTTIIWRSCWPIWSNAIPTMRRWP